MYLLELSNVPEYEGTLLVPVSNIFIIENKYIAKYQYSIHINTITLNHLFFTMCRAIVKQNVYIRYCELDSLSFLILQTFMLCNCHLRQNTTILK